VSLIVLALSLACVAEWLAGIPARDHINRLNSRPVHLGDVAQVWYARVVGFHDFAGRWLYL
jgi:hypothetical protein